MGLAASTVKHTILLFNVLFTILGLILIGCGIFVLVSASQNEIDHGENLAGGIIITVGVVIVLIAVFGCIAAIHESRVKLIIYIVSLIVLILLQLMMASMASLGTKDGLAGSVDEGFEKLWKIEEEKPGALSYYQDWLHCCGVNGTEDYYRIHHDLPNSCCLTHNCYVLTNIYREGCQAKFEDYLSNKMLIFSVVSWILIIAEIIAAFFAWLMLSSLRNQSRRLNASWM